MALACGNCGAKVELSDKQRRQLAGKYFACPECGTSKKLPPFDDNRPIRQIVIEREVRPLSSRENDQEDQQRFGNIVSLVIIGLILSGPTLWLFAWQILSTAPPPIVPEIFVSINIGAAVLGLLLWWFIQPVRQRYFWVVASYFVLMPLVIWYCTGNLPMAVVTTGRIAICAAIIGAIALLACWVLRHWLLIRWLIFVGLGWGGICYVCILAFGPGPARITRQSRVAGAIAVCMVFLSWNLSA